MTLLTRPPRSDDLCPEALIREARRLRRRRWLVGTAVVVVAALVITGIVASTASHVKVTPARLPATPAVAGQPFVNVKAFAHQGELAFISRDVLWVLSGPRGSLRQLTLPKGLTPASPAFSADGKWLAYLGSNVTSDSGSSNLWIARADGTGAHEVPGLAVSSIVGWSSATDVLAVTTTAPDPLNTTIQWPTAISLVSATGNVSALASVASTPPMPTMIENAVWSPDGRQLAVATTGQDGSAVRAYPISGGTPTTWFSISQTATLPDICTDCGGEEVIADLAGWWPKWGIGFWVFSSGMVQNNDDTPIELLTAPGSRPKIIGTTLSDGETDAIASGSNGALALVDSTAGREYGQGKEVENCVRSALSCSPLPGASVWTGADPQPCPMPCITHPSSGSPGSGVTIDPSWSPSGTVLAYVKAPFALTGGWPTLSWYGSHELFIWNADTASTTELADVAGVSVPTWSRNARDLLYVSNDGLWLVPVSGGKPVDIEHPLFPPRQWKTLSGDISYYGQIDWTGQFSWWSP